VDTVNLTPIPSSGGGRTCSNCKGAVRYSQPYRVSRVAASALIAAGIVRVTGVRNLSTFCITTLILWVPVSLFLNAYLIHYIPLFLVPWKPRHDTKTIYEVVNEKNATIELFNNKKER
jgi:uncharacterized membrane protein